MEATEEQRETLDVDRGAGVHAGIMVSASVFNGSFNRSRAGRAGRAGSPAASVQLLGRIPSSVEDPLDACFARVRLLSSASFKEPFKDPFKDPFEPFEDSDDAFMGMEAVILDPPGRGDRAVRRGNQAVRRGDMAVRRDDQAVRRGDQAVPGRYTRATQATHTYHGHYHTNMGGS